MKKEVNQKLSENERKAMRGLLREMPVQDARKSVTPLRSGTMRVYLVAIEIPYRRTAQAPTYKELEQALRPAVKKMGAEWVKAQTYEDYDRRTEHRI